MAAVLVDVHFFTRRQNTNQGEDQYRIWLSRSDADLIAQHIPQLKTSLRANSTWSERVDVSWNNGNTPHQMSFGAYADQSGEISFTASKKTKLFEFAENRHANGQEDHPVAGSCTIDNGVVQAILLDLTL